MKILKILSRNIKKELNRERWWGDTGLWLLWFICALPDNKITTIFFSPLIIHHLCTSPYSGRFTIISVLTEYSGSAFQPQQAYETNPQKSAEKHFALCAKFSESINLQCMLILKVASFAFQNCIHCNSTGVGTVSFAKECLILISFKKTHY